MVQNRTETLEQRGDRGIFLNPFVIGIIICAIIRNLLTANLPIFVIGDSLYDDALMVKLAGSILDSSWLGAYDYNTLVKGAFFPVLLAAFNYLSISYIDGITWMYTISCIFFVYSIRPLFKTKKALFIIYIILLFNPACFSGQILQRVYRNGVTLFQVLFVFGGLIGVYLRREQPTRSLVKWLVIAGIALAALWHTREDGIWIMPFVVVVILILIVSTILRNRRDKNKLQWKKCVSFLIPLILIFGSNHFVSFLNYHAYGIYSYNEINDSNFGDAIEAIYSVKNEKEITYVSVTREKLLRLYDASPSLKSIQGELEAAMDQWSSAGRNPEDMEVEDGWFFWALRDAANRAGYYSSASRVNKFYGKIANEIKEAIDSGLLESQPTMPSPLMSPWREGHTGKLITTFAEIVKYVTTFEDNIVYSTESSTANDGNDIQLFESITNNYAIYPMSPTSDYSLAGWYVYLGGGEVSFVVEDAYGNLVENLVKLDSPDVAEHLADKGIEAQADKVRFGTDIEIEEGTQLYFVVYDSDGNEVDRISLENPGENENHIHIFIFDINGKVNSIRLNIAQKYIDRANFVSNIYQALNVILAVLSVLCFVFLIILTVIRRKTGDKLYRNISLTLAGILLSLVVLFVGVSYNHIASCHSISTLYLSGSYPLLLAFEAIAICAAAETLATVKKGAFKDEYS